VIRLGRRSWPLERLRRLVCLLSVQDHVILEKSDGCEKRKSHIAWTNSWTCITANSWHSDYHSVIRWSHFASTQDVLRLLLLRGLIISAEIQHDAQRQEALRVVMFVLQKPLIPSFFPLYCLHSSFVAYSHSVSSASRIIRAVRSYSEYLKHHRSSSGPLVTASDRFWRQVRHDPWLLLS